MHLLESLHMFFHFILMIFHIHVGQIQKYAVNLILNEQLIPKLIVHGE